MRLMELQNKYLAAKKTVVGVVPFHLPTVCTSVGRWKGMTPTARMATHRGWFPEHLTGSAS
jgi:hypothetical protein